MINAVAYLRTSSATNTGIDKDSEKRQRLAIDGFAKSNKYQIVDYFYDAAVSGSDAIDKRAGFRALLNRLAGNGVKTIICESPDRFARDLAVQLTGQQLLKSLGYDLIPATAPDFFSDETPTARMVMQILGAVAEFERANLVAKLAGARRRKKAATGRCEGRKPLIQTAPEAVALAKQLNRKRKDKPSLRDISKLLAETGYLNEKGRPFNPKSIASMLNSY
jgi:DNA invertase Pin-like site-specific DNA recombinase